MRRERGWSSAAVWLVLLAFAFACGVLVVGQAFDTRVLALSGRSLRLSADYSADPRTVREQKIAPVDSAVISDTVRDLIIEQTPAPLLVLAQTPGLLEATTQPLSVPIQRTATRVAASVTAPATAEYQAPTPTVESVAAPLNEHDNSRPRPTRTPTRTRTDTPTLTRTPSLTPPAPTATASA